MSQQNVEIVRGVYDHFSATKTLDLAAFAPSAVIDMSKFELWPERPLYEGHDGARDYMRAWLEPWEEYEHHLEALHDAGDTVVALLHISATAHHGATVEMRVGHVWTVTDGKIERITAYSEPDQALAAAGLAQ